MAIWLADTNIWLRQSDPAHPMFAEAQRATSKIVAGGETLHLVPQVVTEYWRVVTATASQRGGLAWGVTRAAAEVQRLETLLPLLPDTPDVYRHWKAVVVAAGVTGAGVYDARLVAAMLAHGIGHLLTFNGDDFRRYAGWGITVVHPRDA